MSIIRSFPNRAVLSQPWGGLGDNLSFSTLPELYAEEGIPFYVSHKNAYRNNEIKELVWNLNPYVHGVSHKRKTVGGVPFPFPPKRNHIESIEWLYGFTDTGNRYPKIYYSPKIIKSLEDKTILALGAISVKYSGDGISDALTGIIDDDDLLLLEFKGSLSSGKAHMNYSHEAPKYVVEDIFHHCDVIASCKRYITLLSGSSVLASAVIAETHRKNTEVILTGKYVDKVLYDKRYYFDNLIYVR